MESLNRAALELLEEGIEFAEELRLDVTHLDNDAVVVDFGVDAAGGFEAGLLLAEIQTGGLATVQSRMDTVDGAPRTHVDVSSDHPVLALLGSAHADWRPTESRGFGSGPARLFDHDARFRPDSYEEDFDFAVLAWEADHLPTESMAETVAERCGVPTSGVFLPTYSIDSLAGSVSMAARTAAVAMLRLVHLGYDLAAVRSISATAPAAPVGDGHESALAKTHDAIALGGEVHLVVEEAFDRFDELHYGAIETGEDSMATSFEAIDQDRAAVSGEFVAPAAVTIDVVGRETYRHGARDETSLARLLEG